MDTGMEIDDSITASVPVKEGTMDVESEEGEISEDDADVQADIQACLQGVPDLLKKPEIPGIRVFCPLESEMKIENRAGGFITGIDVFGKDEQARLVERAKRFGLDSSQANLITEESLKKLYQSLDVKKDDDKEFHFDSLLMHGTEAMSTQDVFEYFKDYAPHSIEWIDDESCNVVWLDNLSAIRALMGLSKPIKNLDTYRKQEPKPEQKTTKDKKDNGAVDKSDSDSDVIMIDEDEANSKKVEAIERELSLDPEAIDAIELGLPIPPGRWRKGNTHPNSDGILLRFRPKKSKASYGPQRLPQPVFGMVGLVSKSRKQRIKDGLLVRPKMFVDDMGDERDFVVSSDEETGRNPWGTLAKSWSNIDRARKPPPPIDDDIFGPPSLPALPPILRLPPAAPFPSNSILSRVGPRPAVERRTSHARFSRRQSRSHSRSPSPTPVPQKLKPSIHSRLSYGKRSRRDEQDSDDSAFSGSESDGDTWTKKSKIPRMRMYADEEEVKVKERTKLQARRRLSSPKQQMSSVGTLDLRNRLGREGSRHGVSSRRERDSDFRGADFSDRVVRSERVKRHSRAKPSVRSVASSVFSALSRKEKDRRKVTESSGSDSDESATSSSGEENITITRTVRQGRHDDNDTPDSDSDSESDTVDSDESSERDAAPTTSCDLRSKLGSKKADKNGTTPLSKSVKPRSPLRIEIDNDEYYRSHDKSDDKSS